jgi:peptide/nickel transport system permease protein
MRSLRRFFSRWQNWISVLLILAYIGVALLAPVISPDDPKHPGPFMRVGRLAENRPQPPGEKAPLGMLPTGIDVFHALVWGSRDALQFGLIVTISTALFGILYGALSGFIGNRPGSLMIRVSDAFLALPPIAGLVFLQQLLLTTIGFMGGLNFYSPFFPRLIGPDEPAPFIVRLLEQVNPLMLSLIVLSWMPYARLVHSIVLTLKQTEFVQAARALGGSVSWIIRKHLLRNSTGPAIVLAARDVGGVVLLQATLTFVQIGGDSIWGEMLARGRDWVIGPGGSLLRYWWVFMPPTLAVMIFGIAWNMFGDGLNDALEPTSQRGDHWSIRNRRKKVETEVIAEVPLPVLPPEKEEQKIVGTQPMERVASTDDTDRVLHEARAELSHGDLSRALHAYSHLIRRGRQIEDVLPDLARLVKSHPRDPEVWQTLGDALARAGRVEHANQSYEQARKLRREP